MDALQCNCGIYFKDYADINHKLTENGPPDAKMQEPKENSLKQNGAYYLNTNVKDKWKTT